MLESYRKEDELFAALQHLRHNRHEVVLFHVHDALHEMDFNYENRPYLFVDMESGQEIKAFPHEVKAAYVQAMASFRPELNLRCGQSGIDLVEAAITAAFYTILHTYLVQRTRLGRKEANSLCTCS